MEASGERSCLCLIRFFRLEVSLLCCDQGSKSWLIRVSCGSNDRFSSRSRVLIELNKACFSICFGFLSRGECSIRSLKLCCVSSCCSDISLCIDYVLRKCHEIRICSCNCLCCGSCCRLCCCKGCRKSCSSCLEGISIDAHIGWIGNRCCFDQVL